VCPETTTSYELRVQHVDGSTEIRSITIQVNQSNTLIDTSWFVTSLNVNQVPLPGSNLTLQFIGENSVSANGGCNTFSGGYAVSFSSISIGPLAGSRKSCGADLDTQESAYIQALESATMFTSSSNQLILYDPGNVEVARLSPLVAVPLNGG
jgi:heat shock protein HslJ